MKKKKVYTFDEGYEIIEKLLGYTKDEVEALLPRNIFFSISLDILSYIEI